jgi:hypothetical protein
MTNEEYHIANAALVDEIHDRLQKINRAFQNLTDDREIQVAIGIFHAEIGDLFWTLGMLKGSLVKAGGPIAKGAWYEQS